MKPFQQLGADESLVEVEFDEAVAIVRLNRPERRNALGPVLVERLAIALGDLDDRTDVSAVVLTGAEPGFCAGSDLKELAGRTVPEMVEEETRLATLTRGIVAMRTPVIAAVEGFAVGGGCMLAAACDVVVTGKSCRWHLSEVSLGWLPPWGLGPLIDRVGIARARLLTFGPWPIDGVEATGVGLADSVVADGSAVPRAREVAAALAALPAGAVASTKRLFAEQSACEDLDARATALFADDVRSTEARTSLARFGVVVASDSG